MSEMLQIVQDIHKKSDYIKEVLHLHKSMIKESILDILDEEELEKTDRVIMVVSEKPEAALERFLIQKDRHFYYGIHEDTGMLRYIFPDLSFSKPFSSELCMEAFREYCDENEEELTKRHFCFDVFEYLKEEEFIPYGYELYTTSTAPEYNWETVRHYVLYNREIPLYSERIDNIFKVLSYTGKRLYMDLEPLETWANKVFSIIEKTEKKKQGM